MQTFGLHGEKSSRPNVAMNRGIDIAPLAIWPVFGAMATLAAVLTVFSAGYGYHRDELYFRMLHPAWGYFDQPPLTPFLARLTTHLADATWALRIPATLATVLSVLVIALITREVGGRRKAQALSAWGYGFATLPVVLGHALLTSAIDLPIWPAIVLFAIRAQLRREPRWWLWAGVVVGVGTYNKLLVAVLVACLAAGFLVSGPREVFRSRCVWAAVGIAVLVGLPNLIYQATHHFPQLTIGHALADHNGSSVRVQMWPFLFLALGPPLSAIWIAALVSLRRRPQWRPVRFLVPSFGALLLAVFVMGSQFYYYLGLLASLYAIGCVPAAEWMAGWRHRLVVAGVALNGAVSVVMGLPLIPVTQLHATPIPGINQVVQDSIGWPRYVDQIAAVYRKLPVGDQRQTVLIASNYGEAGAIARYGPALGLPPVYSGQNALWFQARPPATATAAVVVGGQLAVSTRDFDTCRLAGRLDNAVGVDNEEQGEPIAVCHGPHGGWSAEWPRLKHAD